MDYMPQVFDSKGRYLFMIHCATCGLTHEQWLNGLRAPTICGHCGSDWIAVKAVREVE